MKGSGTFVDTLQATTRKAQGSCETVFKKSLEKQLPKLFQVVREGRKSCRIGLDVNAVANVTFLEECGLEVKEIASNWYDLPHMFKVTCVDKEKLFQKEREMCEKFIEKTLKPILSSYANGGKSKSFFSVVPSRNRIVFWHNNGGCGGWGSGYNGFLFTMDMFREVCESQGLFVCKRKPEVCCGFSWEHQFPWKIYWMEKSKSQ